MHLKIVRFSYSLIANVCLFMYIINGTCLQMKPAEMFLFAAFVASSLPEM